MPNRSIVWHSGGTDSLGSYIGILVDTDVGVIVPTNEENGGFPDVIGLWVFDRLLDNPPPLWPIGGGTQNGTSET